MSRFFYQDPHARLKRCHSRSSLRELQSRTALKQGARTPLSTKNYRSHVREQCTHHTYILSVSSRSPPRPHELDLAFLHLVTSHVAKILRSKKSYGHSVTSIIVNRGKWLRSPVNIKEGDKQTNICLGRSLTLHFLSYAHCLCVNNLSQCFY